MADQIYFSEGADIPCCPSAIYQGIMWQGYSLLTSTTSPVELSEGFSDNLINQSGSVDPFTFILPPNPYDGQESSLTFNSAASNVTIDGNGRSVVNGMIASVSIGDRLTFKYYADVNSWIRIT